MTAEREDDGRMHYFTALRRGLFPSSAAIDEISGFMKKASLAG
jgi:hypothetical protein